MFDKAMEIAERLQQDEVTKILERTRNTETESTDPVYNDALRVGRAGLCLEVEKAMQDPELRATIHSNYGDPDAIGLRVFKDIIGELYANKYAILGEWLLDNTKWCVD
ncbi:hypothetical protein MMC21_005309 [Puttea exsequens]|nr:hypothetical protein [Puttea exsequens]